MITIPLVFVITGTPGTGKTTVSRVLSDKLDARHIEISSYSKEKGYILEEDEGRDTSIVDMDALKVAVSKEIAESTKTVLLDGHYAHDLVAPEKVDWVFVLRKQPWDLKTVYEIRQYSNEKIWENLEAEIIGVISEESIDAFPEDKIVELDTSEKTPEETTEEILTILVEGKRHGATPIDWVSYPETLRLLMSRPCTLS